MRHDTALIRLFPVICADFLPPEINERRRQETEGHGQGNDPLEAMFWLHDLSEVVDALPPRSPSAQPGHPHPAHIVCKFLDGQGFHFTLRWQPVADG